MIGDWVVAAFPDGEPGVIEKVLPRRSAFSRRAAGDRPDEQVIAANIDIVFLMSACDGDLNPSRMERYLVAAGRAARDRWSFSTRRIRSGSRRRRCASPGRRRAHADPSRVAPHERRARRRPGLSAGRRHRRPPRELGVGKSTLVNVLLGEERQRTAVLTNENRGRHTTTHRELFQLPGGGLMIDTPGMRELQLWDSPRGLDAAFPEIRRSPPNASTAIARTPATTDARSSKRWPRGRWMGPLQSLPETQGRADRARAPARGSRPDPSATEDEPLARRRKRG